MFTVAVWLLAWQGPAPTLAEAWSLDAGLTAPESVVYDATRDRIYVAVKGGVASIEPNGAMDDAAWIKGLGRPRGLALAGDRLYLADGPDALAARLPSGEIADRWKTPSRELTDLACDEEGRIFACDRSGNRLYALRNGKAELFTAGEFLHQPNALLLEGQLYIACWGGPVERGAIRALPLQPDAVTSLWSNPIGRLAGLTSDGNYGFYTADRESGAIYHVAEDGRQSAVLQLEPGVADLWRIPEKSLLLVAHAKANALLAFKITAN